MGWESNNDSLISLHVHVVIIHKSDTPRRLLNSKIWPLLDKLGQAISSCHTHLETLIVSSLK